MSHRRRYCSFERLESRALLAANLMSFQDGLYPDVSYDGTRDIRIEGFDPNKNYNYSDRLEIDGSPENTSSMLSWDISQIPTDAVLQSVSITVNVVDPTNDTYEIYQVLRPWVEDQATWTEAANGSSWQTSGAQGAADRGNVVLGVIAASASGLRRVELNSAGVAVVQNWLRDPSTNHGLIIQDYSEDNGLDLNSRETANPAERPRLDLEYTFEIAPPPPSEPAVVSFQDGAYPTTDYSGTQDVRISSGSPTKNYNYSDELWVDGSPADVAALLRWDISQIPTEAVLQSVTITLDVIDPSNDTYEVYELLRPWSESQVTWSRAAGGTTWQSAGAQGVQDRGSEVLGVICAPSTGPATLELNRAGIAVVQRWIADASSNHGLIFQDYSAAANGLDFYSRETLNSSARPRLTLAYTIPATALAPYSQLAVAESRDMSGMALTSATTLTVDPYAPLQADTRPQTLGLARRPATRPSPVGPSSDAWRAAGLLELGWKDSSDNSGERAPKHLRDGGPLDLDLRFVEESSRARAAGVVGA